MPRLKLLIALMLVACTVPADAQTPAPNPLAGLTSLRCRFPVAATATWKDGQPQAASRAQELTFELSNIDTQDGTAEFTGATGKAFVSAVLSGPSVYFVESAFGQLNVTTVFAQEASKGQLKAVHSRHGYVQMSVGTYTAEPSVSQNYGSCEAGS